MILLKTELPTDRTQKQVYKFLKFLILYRTLTRTIILLINVHLSVGVQGVILSLK